MTTIRDHIKKKSHDFLRSVCFSVLFFLFFFFCSFFFSSPCRFWKEISGCRHGLWLSGRAPWVVWADFMIYSANGKGAWPPVATERELHVGLMLSPQKCLLWLSSAAEVTVWMVLKRNLGIKCALFTIDRLLGLGQGVPTQFQRIAWKLLGKLELCNLFLPVSLVSYPVKDLPHMLFFPLSSVTKESFKMCQLVHFTVIVDVSLFFCRCWSGPWITVWLFLNVNLKL